MSPAQARGAGLREGNEDGRPAEAPILVAASGAMKT